MAFFSSEKEENKQFKVPLEIVELRMRIETESRERYPSLASYREIARKAESAYHYLDNSIAEKKHPDEAAKIKEEIRINLEGLRKKIHFNLRKPKKKTNRIMWKATSTILSVKV